MQNQSKQPSLTQPQNAPTSYKSRFFGNYLDTSQTSIESDVSFSYHDNASQQRKYVQLSHLLSTHRKIMLRLAVEKWKTQKEIIVRKEKRNTGYFKKVLMKVSMLVNVKVRTRCHAFFIIAKKAMEVFKNQSQKDQEEEIEKKKIDILEKQRSIDQEKIVGQEKQKQNEKLRRPIEPYYQPLPHSNELPSVTCIIPFIPSKQIQIKQTSPTKNKKQQPSQSHHQLKQKQKAEPSPPPIPTKKPQSQSEQKKVKKDETYQRTVQKTRSTKQILNRLNSISQGAVKLYKFIHNFQAKYLNDDNLRLFLHTLHKNNSQYHSLQFIFNIINKQNLQLYELSYQRIKRWITFVDKIDIFISTINLLNHSVIRYAFLRLQIYVSRLDKSQNRSCSLMSNSSQNKIIQKSVVSQYTISQHQKIEEIPQGFKKKQSAPECQTQNSNANILPLTVQKQTQQLLTQNILNYKSTNHTISSRAVEELSVSKHEGVDQSISILLKPSKPISLNLIQPKKMVLTLEDNLHLEINKNRDKPFCNSSHSTRGFPVRTDQMRKDLTDFNDLFFARQVHNFYLSYDPPRPNNREQQILPRHFASSHQIKEEYSSFNVDNHHHRNDNQEEKHLMPLTFKGAARKQQHSSRSRHSKRPSQTKIQQNIYISPLAFTSRRKMKIPTELPKNFDYYADKSLSRHSNKQSAPKSNNSSLHDVNRRQSHSQLNKKIFKEVKGSHSCRKMLTSPTALKVPDQGLSKVSKGSKGSRGSKKQRSNRSCKKQLRTQPRELKSPERGEYLFAFNRHPPKKKGRKQC